MCLIWINENNAFQLLAPDTFKGWLKALHKSADLSCVELQNPGSLMLVLYRLQNLFYLQKLFKSCFYQACAKLASENAKWNFTNVHIFIIQTKT